MERSFEAKHPEIDVRWLDMGSQEVYDRIRAEKSNPQCDVWYGGPNTIFARGAREGLLAPFRPGWAEAIAPESRNSQSLYFGLYRTPAVIVYNTAAIPADAAPRDWDDLLDPRWKKKVLIRYPLASGTMRAFFAMVLSRSIDETGSPEHGFDWLRRLDGQTSEYEMNASVLVEKIARREGWLTVWDLPDVLLEMQRSSGLAYVFPASGTPVIDDAVGLTAGARHPELARAFIEWLGSPEAQIAAAQSAFRLPALRDLSEAQLPQWAREVEKIMVPARLDWNRIERDGPGWMARWDREVRGKGKN
jgi:iron(III) transport system substrate-binding protein